MVAWAMESFRHLQPSKLIFVVLREHEDTFGVSRELRLLGGDRAEVHVIPDVTEGQLCTVLEAARWIDTDEDLLIASADTYVDSDLGRDIERRRADCHGLISVARLPGDHWSFASVDEAGRVTRVAEKERISPLASTGLYYFSNGRRFVKTASDMVARGMKTRGEYFVIPVYQRYVDDGLFVGVSEARSMWDMGTPAAARIFEEHINARTRADD